MISMTGSMSAACTTKRAAVIWPTGTPFWAASLAATSSKGAIAQNAIIKRTP